MAFKYTGRADTFRFNNKIYAKPELYNKHPDLYDASYDKPITGMTEAVALRMASNSRLHSFEDTGTGEDLLTSATNPDLAGVDVSTVKADALKVGDKK